MNERASKCPNERSGPSGWVTVEIRYHHRGAGAVRLIWGVDGWRPVPEERRLTGTVLSEAGVMHTSMVRQGDVLVARVQVPPGARLDYGFLAGFAWQTVTTRDSVIEVWPGAAPASKRRILASAKRRIARFITRRGRRVGYARFIIMSQGRSGSSHLLSLLDSHPGIQTYGELFRHDPAERKRTSRAAGPIGPGEDPIAYLESCIYREYPEHVKAVGFKMMDSHARADWQDVWAYLRDARVRVIHLKRRNLLDRYLSEQLALRSGVWGTFQPGQSTAHNEPIELDPAACFRNTVSKLQRQEQADSLFQDNPRLEVYYEDLVEDTTGECRRILDFLGLEFQELTSPMVKQRTRRKPEVIANYDELKEFFANGAPESTREKWLGYFDDEEV